MRSPALSISAALERRPKLLPLRATLDSINVKVFADNKQLQQIDNSNWQVLFGRRRGGKDHASRHLCQLHQPPVRKWHSRVDRAERY